MLKGRVPLSYAVAAGPGCALEHYVRADGKSGYYRPQPGHPSGMTFSTRGGPLECGPESWQSGRMRRT